jgi:ubiquitin C-terminal hydrolase
LASTTLESNTKKIVYDEKSEVFNNHVPRYELIKDINRQNKSLIEKYVKEGPFVYELFACLLHQGGAMGGHYYAYIKDIENQNNWSNFNDYRVSGIDLVDITEMFGGNKGKGVA